MASAYAAGVTDKERLSATVDADLLAAARAAVASGRAESVSAWVNEALALKAAHEQRLTALASVLEDYERQHGEITAEEIAAATRRARGSAAVVRGRASA